MFLRNQQTYDETRDTTAHAYVEGDLVRISV